MFEHVEIERSENIGHAQRSRRVARFCFREHFDHRFSNGKCLRLDASHFLIGHHTATFIKFNPVSSSRLRIKGWVTSQRQSSSVSATVAARKCPPIVSSESSQRESTACACTTGSSPSVSEMFPSILATSKGPSSLLHTSSRLGRSTSPNST